MRHRPAVVAVLAGVLLAGCSTSGGSVSSPSAATSDATATTDAIAGLRRVLEDVWSTRPDLDRRHRVLMETCMFGDAPRPAVPVAEQTDETFPLKAVPKVDRFLSGRLSVGPADSFSDAAAVRSWAEARRGTRAPGAPVDPPGYDELAYGKGPRYITFRYSPEGGEISFPLTGCHGRAVQELYGVPPAQYYETYWRVPRELRWLEMAVQDPAVRAAVEGYGACMHRSGYEVKDPGQVYDALDAALENLRSAQDLTRLRTTQRELLEADAGCKHDTGAHVAFGRAFLAAARADLSAAQPSVAAYRALIQHATGGRTPAAGAG